MELWGGLECTVNRVQDTYHDQLQYSGHDRRIEDLNQFSEVGLKTLRYPFLWERTAPQGIASADWSWADGRIKKFAELGMHPIVGLVHHGSGPKYTHLLDPEFPEKLAEYAAAFATRYPHIQDYTPINEPLTTARFSALYGIWYPHCRDELSFYRALLNQCRGTVLSMREIRRVNPQARLIQTDDLGKASSTPFLAYQAEYENQRRWLSWDLLCGRVDRHHFFWPLMIGAGVQPDELRWFKDNACPPDLLGINHYLLSNRHLDERLERYPTWSYGGNGRHSYADIESVRVKDQEFISPQVIFKEAWERYKLPIAITEVHLDDSSEDQIRWFMEVWSSAKRLRESGVDIRAVTSWGLLGHFDWNCLVSRQEGYYSSGAFDLRGGKPRPTAMVDMLRMLGDTGNFTHPMLDVPGWWRGPTRYFEQTQWRQIR